MLMCFKTLRTSNLSTDQKSVMLKYNLLTPDHSVPNAQLKYTEQQDVPFICHLLDRALPQKDVKSPKEVNPPVSQRFLLLR